MSTEAFLPEGYEVPKGQSSYLKFQTGENKFRILTRPIIGWSDWKDKKPYRFTMDKKPAAPFDPKQDIKHFWAFVVYDYSTRKISILEITQTGVQTAIKNLQANSDWGSPLGYDITVTKSGSGMETKYATVPSPPKPVHAAITKLFSETPVNLQALFDGKDPFDANPTAVVPEYAPPADLSGQPDDDDDLPF